MTGPAIATAPDGGVWATLFGDDGGLVRYGPDGSRHYYEVGLSGKWLRSSRFIHMRFVQMCAARPRALARARARPPPRRVLPRRATHAPCAEGRRAFGPRGARRVGRTVSSYTRWTA